MYKKGIRGDKEESSVAGWVVCHSEKSLEEVAFDQVFR